MIVDNDLAPSTQKQSNTKPREQSTAIVYCEGNFASIDGKTANGLVRHSEKYNILSIIDSEKTGLDAGNVLDNKPNSIPIVKDLDEAILTASSMPDYFIWGTAPATGKLSEKDRKIVLKAISLGMNIVNGLHEFLNDDPEFIAASIKQNIQIIDIRKPPSGEDLHLYSGRIKTVAALRIAVLGTDCAIGKRTTANILTKVLNLNGIKTVMVGTGQTGLIQGARYGIALDAIPSQFCVGELEAKIVEADETEQPDVIIIEGQGALSHPAFGSSVFILKGSQPQGVILQHAPARQFRCDFESIVVPSAESEIKLIEMFADTTVIGLALNHEHLSDEELINLINQYKSELDLPVTDALTCPAEELLKMVLLAFPKLEVKVKREFI